MSNELQTTLTLEDPDWDEVSNPPNKDPPTPELEEEDPDETSIKEHLSVWNYPLPYMDIEKAIPEKITGNEPDGIIHLLLSILPLVAKYNLGNETMQLVMISRVVKKTHLHRMIQENYSQDKTWPSLLWALHKRFPGHPGNPGRYPYLDALQKLEKYQGPNCLGNNANLNTLVMFLEIHNLCRTYSKAARGAFFSNETDIECIRRRFRDKVGSVAPTKLPMIINAEKEATRLGEDMFETLFLQTADAFLQNLT